MTDILNHPANERLVVAIDDQPLILELLKATLEGTPGIRLSTATSGAEGLQQCQAEPPVLVLLDVELPDVDGFTLCRQLKRDPVTAGAQVIIMSAMNQSDDVYRAACAGADDYIFKPFSPSRLAEVVQGRLGTDRHALAAVAAG